MRLDRNINGTGHGKYGLINNRRRLSVGLTQHVSAADAERFKRIEAAIAVLEEERIIDWGIKGTASEFFVIKLRDAYAADALRAYAEAAGADAEYADEIDALVMRAGHASPFCKKPD